YRDEQEYGRLAGNSHDYPDTCRQTCDYAHLTLPRPCPSNHHVTAHLGKLPNGSNAASTTTAATPRNGAAGTRQQHGRGGGQPSLQPSGFVRTADVRDGPPPPLSPTTSSGTMATMTSSGMADCNRFAMRLHGAAIRA